MYFANVPDVLGVPALPRIPPAVVSGVGDDLDQATSILAGLGVTARNSPLAAMSSLLPGMQDAQSLVSGVASTFTQYPSSLFDPFNGPVSDVQSSLTSITNTINANPTGPAATVSGALDNATDLTSNVADDYAADTSVDTASTDDVESVTVTAYKGQPQWGIFLSGKSVISADNVVGFEYKKDWTISDYPVEEGAFQSYDKVELPYDARVRFSCGGSLDTRTGFLKSVEDAAATLELYDVVTPTKTYQSANIVHLDYRQTASNGLGLMVVDVYLEEIRNTATATFSQTTDGQNSPPQPTNTPAPKSPSAAPQVNGGTKQPQAIPPQSSTAVGTALLNTLL